MANRVILIIDDDKAICTVIKEALEQLGEFEIIAAYNGTDGLKMAKQVKPDLVLLDINMPVMDGFRVLELLKKDPEIFYIPVVMIAGQNDNAYRIGASRLYSEDYLAKPISVIDLKVKIDTILARFGI